MGRRINRQYAGGTQLLRQPHRHGLVQVWVNILLTPNTHGGKLPLNRTTGLHSQPGIARIETHQLTATATCSHADDIGTHALQRCVAHFAAHQIGNSGAAELLAATHGQTSQPHQLNIQRQAFNLAGGLAGRINHGDQ